MDGTVLVGYVEGVTHEYKGHGATTLFAALNVRGGAVLASCKPRHWHQEYLCFLREIDQAVPAESDIHCIADNYATHNHPKIKAWLAARPRWRMHFIPTYSSWLNQVERFFSLIADKAIRRGSFTSVKQLANLYLARRSLGPATGVGVSRIPKVGRIAICLPSMAHEQSRKADYAFLICPTRATRARGSYQASGYPLSPAY